MKKKVIKVNGKKIKLELLTPQDLENESVRNSVPQNILNDIKIQRKVLPKIKQINLSKEEIENNKKFLQLVKGLTVNGRDKSN